MFFHGFFCKTFRVWKFISRIVLEIPPGLPAGISQELLLENLEWIALEIVTETRPGILPKTHPGMHS